MAWHAQVRHYRHNTAIAYLIRSKINIFWGKNSPHGIVKLIGTQWNPSWKECYSTHSVNPNTILTIACKVDISHSIIIFKERRHLLNVWLIVAPTNKYHKDMCRKINWTMCWKYDNHHRLNNPHNWRNLYDHLLSTTFFTLITIKIIIQAPKTIRKLLQLRFGIANYCPGNFWAYIVSQDPSDSKSNRLHIDIFPFCFIHLRYILHIPLKWMVIILKSRTATGYFSNSNNFL